MRKIMISFILGLALVFTGCAGNQQDNNAAPNNNSKSSAEQRTFTLDELKEYNGQNGKPAYVAVNGVVYDVSKSDLWKNGLHNQCSDSTYAGADLSKAISLSPHGSAIMNKMPVVGKLEK